MSRLIDIALAPLYTTVGIGDVLSDRAARAEMLAATHERLDGVARRGKNVTFDAITSLPVIGAAIGARIAYEEHEEHEEHEEYEPQAGWRGSAVGGPASVPFSLLTPLTNPVAAFSLVRSLLGGRARVPSTAPLGPSTERVAEQDALRTKLTAASRTSSPAPSPHRQPMVEQLGDPPARMTGTRTVRPSGVEAASTATRAARRAALRMEQE